MADDIIIKISLQGAKEELNKLEKLQKGINRLADEKKRLNKSEKELTKAINESGAATAQQNASLEKIAQQQVKNNAALKLSKKAYSDNERQVIANTKANNLNKGSLVELRAQLSKDTFAFDRLTKAERENVNIGGRLQKSIKKQSDELKKLEDQTGRNQRSVGDYKKSFGSLRSLMLKGLGALGITAGLAGLVNVMKGAVKIAKDFEQGNANLAAVLGKSRKEITKLTDDAKRLGAITSFTASEVSKLQTEFAKLGFNEKQILDATEATLDLAAATGSDLAEAAGVAGATLGGFGLKADQTQRVVDVMAKSFSTSALDIEKFRESMKTAAPAAAAVGVSIEETTALLGTLANAGISGSIAGTALRKTFIDLNKAGLTLDEALAQVSNSQNKLGTATDLVGTKAASAFLVLAKGTGTTKALEAGLNNAGGAAKKMADEQLDTLEGKTKILGSAWEGLVLSLLAGDGAFSRMSKSIVEAATGILTFFTNSEDANKASFEGAKANRELANSSQKLLDEYESLVEDGVTPTIEEKEKLDIITLKLKSRLGESVVAIDAETGAFVLNTDAVREQIKIKRFSSDQEAATLASRLKGVQEEIKEQKRIAGIQKKIKDTAQKQVQSDIEIENKRVTDLAKQGKSTITRVTKDAQETRKLRNRALAEERDANETIIKQKEIEEDLIAKLKELNFSAADAEALFALEIENSTKAKEANAESSENTIKTTKKETEAIKGLLTEQEKLKEIAEKLPELTEAEITAKNLKIQTIDKEISRLKNLGETQEDLNKKEADAIDKKIEGLQLLRQLELATIDETNEEKIRKETELLDTIGALRVAKAKLNGEDVTRVELENDIAKAEQKNKFEAEQKEKEKVTKEEEKEAQDVIDEEEVVAAKLKEEKRTAIKNTAIEAGEEVQKLIFDNQKRRIEENSRREIEALNLKRQTGEINEEEFEKKRKEIDKKAFEDGKKVALKENIIDFAVAAGETIAKLGWPLALPALIPLGLKAISTAATIKSQKFSKGGVLHGASHAQGGVNLGNNQEGEGGEAIINKRSTAKHLPLLSAINQDGGGVSLGGTASPSTGALSKFGNGGIINNVTNQSGGLDIDELRQAFSDSINTIKVQNVASETTEVANRVETIQDSATF